MSLRYEDIFSKETMNSLRDKSFLSLNNLMGNKRGRDIGRVMMTLLSEVMEIEEPYHDELAEAAIQMVKKVFPIIEYANIGIDAKISSMENIDSQLFESLSSEQKRRIVNAITHGAAIRGTFSFLLFREYLDLLNPDLVDKYKDLMNATFSGYDDDNSIAFMLSQLQQNTSMGGGLSKVIYKGDKKTPKEDEDEFKFDDEEDQQYPENDPDENDDSSNGEEENQPNSS